MTTNGNWTKTANGARGKAPGGATAFASRMPIRLTRRALRWKQDAVCRETGAADADSDRTEAESVSPAGTGSAGSSITRTIFHIPHFNSNSNPKGTPNTTQKKKGKNQNTVTVRKKLVTLA